MEKDLCSSSAGSSERENVFHNKRFYLLYCLVWFLPCGKLKWSCVFCSSFKVLLPKKLGTVAMAWAGMVGSAGFSEEQCIISSSRVRSVGLQYFCKEGSLLVYWHRDFAVLQVRSQYWGDSFTSLLCFCRMLQRAFVLRSVCKTSVFEDQVQGFHSMLSRRWIIIVSGFL